MKRLRASRLRRQGGPSEESPQLEVVDAPGTDEPQRSPKSCWDAACKQLRDEDPKRFKILQSAQKDSDLNQNEFRARIQNMAIEQAAKERLAVKFTRLVAALRPFEKLAMTAARLDPHHIAPFAVGGLYLILEVSCPNLTKNECH